MKQRWLYILFLLLPFTAKGQGENNMWTFITGPGVPYLLNLGNSNGLPVIQQQTSSVSWASCAVCYPNGQLRFIFSLRSNTPNVHSPEIIRPDGTFVTNSDFLSGIMTDGCMPVVVPRPGNPDEYYCIYSYSNGLVYSLLDMAANNGSGAVIEKDKIISPYGTVVAEKLGAVPGCDGVWIVTRSRLHNEWLSFHITDNGVDTVPVISTAGNFTSYDYGYILLTRRFKVSPDGSHIAISSWKGIELIDFEKCSGKLKNARVIDTTGNILPAVQTLNNYRLFRDVCFSPDGTKLYATFNDVEGTNLPGKLYQYDLSGNSLAAIIASKTLILTNLPSIVAVASVCGYIIQNPLGEMKCGPDGKLYIDNGSRTCRDISNIPVGYNPGAAFHTLTYPNLSGLNCQPEYNTLVVNGAPGIGQGREFYYSGLSWSSLQQNIVVPPPTPDTLPGNDLQLATCFRDSVCLSADTVASCFRWDNGSTEPNRYVSESGTYWVQYFKDCNFSIDTFQVRFSKLPYLGVLQQNCPGWHRGTVAAYYRDNESHPMRYTWRSEDGSILRQKEANRGDTLSGLSAGAYYVEIQDPSGGCDTILSATIENMPKPDVNVLPIDTTIKYGDSITVRASGATNYIWTPSAVLNNSAVADPVAKPETPVLLIVIGMNEYGCTDSVNARINIDYNMPVLIPNAFTPNGDGRNDIFKIEGFTFQKLHRFSIYNRYGQPVFSSLNGNKGWDGTFNGRPCDAGTYYYIITLENPNGNSQTYKGDVLLIR